MKFALGFLTCCLLVIVGTVVFAPESAHKIIDKFHDNPTHITKPQLTENDNKTNENDNNKNSNKANEDDNIVDSSEPPKQRGRSAYVVPQKTNTEKPKTSEPPEQNKRAVYLAPIRLNTEKPRTSEPPKQRGRSAYVVPQKTNTEKSNAFQLPAEERNVAWTMPSTKKQLLEWLKSEDYTVAPEQDFYRITWRNRKRSSSKPSIVVVNGNGKVTVRYGNNVVVNADDSIVLGQNVVVRGRNNITIGVNNGQISKTSAGGITNTVSMKYESGYWWIVTTHSFNWYIGQDRIKNVWLKAKKIKEINDEN